MIYRTRVAENTLSKYLSNFPVVGITGPRQSGKSTMLRHLLRASYRYVTFDDFQTMTAFHDDPQKFMRLHGDHVIFDEVQRVPELFLHIKIAVDADPSRNGIFVLTGSSQFTFMKNISDSLAGRIGLLTLLPFQFSEIPAQLRKKSLIRGGYPGLVSRKYRASEDWYSSYIETYINRDVRELLKIVDLRDFRRCLQMLASRVSQILVMSDIARDVGVSVPTIKHWISVLEASYIVFLLPPYYNNMGKRIVKSPKLYFYDAGLAAFMTGIINEDLFEKGPMTGALFENYIVSEVYKRELHTKTHSELFFYRTSNGEEIDLIVDRKSRRHFIEIKSSETYSPTMMRAVEGMKGKNDSGALIYRGKDNKEMDLYNYTTYLASME